MKNILSNYFITTDIHTQDDCVRNMLDYYRKYYTTKYPHLEKSFTRGCFSIQPIDNNTVIVYYGDAYDEIAFVHHVKS